MNHIAAIRRDYRLQTLDEKDVQPNAIDQFTRWWQDAVNSEIDEVNAMTLATASPDGKPAARIVLLKGYDEKGFVFFTNYNSLKGRSLQHNQQACLVFFWKELERQVKIEGLAEKLTDAENDEYYFSRPQGSQLGAWASPQSTVIAGRHILEDKLREVTEKFKEQPIVRPPHWGGFRIQPSLIEFWQGRPSRLHDRLQYSLKGSEWIIERLAP